jgi:hypothetical protein
MPGTPGVIRGELLVCFQFFAHEAAGTSRARHSLRPLNAKGGTFYMNLREILAARSRSCVHDMAGCLKS